jgi:hypothetical protein
MANVLLPARTSESIKENPSLGSRVCVSQWRVDAMEWSDIQLRKHHTRMHFLAIFYSSPLCTFCRLQMHLFVLCAGLIMTKCWSLAMRKVCKCRVVREAGAHSELFLRRCCAYLAVDHEQHRSTLTVVLIANLRKESSCLVCEIIRASVLTRNRFATCASRRQVKLNFCENSNEICV